MVADTEDGVIFALTKAHDNKNLELIEKAFSEDRIDNATREYLITLYSNSMNNFREVFLYIGKCFGAPKAAVHAYDYETDSAVNKKITISDINPLEPYLVNHRLDEDPMRNQFFVATRGHKIDLAVSSIVTVIVGAQKSVARTLDKITGKYYNDYVNEVAQTAYMVIGRTKKLASARAISDKIHETFSKSFITDASAKVLKIIGSGHEQVSVELVRALDQIRTPYARLEDVWRIKCLFDLVPQARTFIERICNMWPDKIIAVRDKFFDIANPRGYRDAKLILNIGTADKVIPMEIICQVRTFFEFEHQTHAAYEKSRRAETRKIKSAAQIETQTEILHQEGIKKYNAIICECVEDLFDRIGWNILYSAGNEDKLFEGFPRISTVYYPQKITDIIMEKVDNAVENEVFYVENAPAKLTRDQEIRIFRWMAKFILVSAMPYSDSNWTVNTDTMSGKFFNFIMKELQRYYKK
ncbi:MAG: hypothetical protein IKF41_00280 [Alphaproteobacteria bacterium]|nr:hypothetical protein [Alphaproteobacteria bacterium]